MKTRPSKHYRLCVGGLTALYALWWFFLAIEPSYRNDWILENMLLLIAVPLLLWIQRHAPLSLTSCTLIFAFLSMHSLGAHYTYSEVPYDKWMQALGGTSVSTLTGWQRNHYDRLVHLCFGLFLAYPVRELLLRKVKLPKALGYIFPVTILMAASSIYEIIEWTAAMVFGSNLGMAYLGTQGDVWDSQKDELIAMIGSILAMVFTAIIIRCRPKKG